MAMITVKNLQKDFKKVVKQPGLMNAFKSLLKPQTEIFEAVKDLSFEVPKGEILGFIGPNGAGKSTTIKMLTGIMTPTSGFVEINGQIPQEDRVHYVKEIGAVFGQRTQLWWDLPLQETYGVLKEIYEIPEQKFKVRLSFLYDVLGLKEFIKSPVRTLSLGQRMRADIAASLLHSPKVLFLDEPTIGLDVEVKDNIRKAITQINQEEETTIILTTHDLADIELLSDRIFMIDHGEAIFDGSVEALKQEFGGMHGLEIELASPKAVTYNQFPDIEVAQDGSRLAIKFDASKYAVGDLLSATLAQAPIKDMVVRDADIEDIIRRFYRKELETDVSKAS